MAASDETARRYLYRKIDLRLMPLLMLTDFFNTLVRANLPNALVAGMDQDLNLDASKQSHATAIFFAPYVIFGKYFHPVVPQQSLDLPWRFLIFRG